VRAGGGRALWLGRRPLRRGLNAATPWPLYLRSYAVLASHRLHARDSGGDHKSSKPVTNKQLRDVLPLLERLYRRAPSYNMRMKYKGGGWEKDVCTAPALARTAGKTVVRTRVVPQF